MKTPGPRNRSPLAKLLKLTDLQSGYSLSSTQVLKEMGAMTKQADTDRNFPTNIYNSNIYYAMVGNGINIVGSEIGGTNTVK